MDLKEMLLAQIFQLLMMVSKLDRENNVYRKVKKQKKNDEKNRHIIELIHTTAQ